MLSAEPRSATPNTKITVNKKKKPAFGQYFVSLITATLILTSISGIDFLLSLINGGYQIFTPQGFPQLEVIYILSGIAIISFLIMFLLSFSNFLQNVLIGLFAAGVSYVFMYQFGNFKPSAALSILLFPHDLFLYQSHILIPAFFGLSAFLFMGVTQKCTQFYFAGTLFVLFATFGGYLYITKPQAQQFMTVYESDLVRPEVKTPKKFVYISLEGLPSYNLIKDWNEEKANIMLGFFANNNFTLYPNAYVSEKSWESNMAQILNLNTAAVSGTLLQNIEVAGYWDFNKISDESVFLKSNNLYDILQKANYDVIAYQNNGLDFCKINNKYSINKCVDMQTRMVDLDHKILTPFNKTVVLVAEWINSMHTGLKMPKVLSQNLDIFNKSLQDVFVINSIKQLETAFDDIAKNNSQAAYFIHLNLPNNLYVFNEYCTLKPIKEWKEKADDRTINKQKQNLLIEQSLCLYGKLQELITKTNAPNTVYVIASESSAMGLEDNINKSFINNFKSENLISFAILDPLQSEFKADYSICGKHKLLAKYLFKKDTCTIKDLKLQETAQKEVQKDLQTPFDDKIDMAKSAFANWYLEYKKRNSIE